ncbi:MAG: hypothetical protein ACTHPD_08480 [Rhizomicrobium sp.]
MRRHWTETLFAVAALFVSAVSLWIGIRTEEANEKLVEASTWPFLQIDSSNTDGQNHSVLSFEVVNSGVGPAKVKTFEVFWKGKPFRTSSELMHDCCGYAFPTVDIAKLEGGSVALVTSARMTKTVIRAGGESPFLNFPLNEKNADAWRKFDSERQNGNIRFRICYCSVFDECFLDEADFSGNQGPSRVDTCPVPKVGYIQ